MGQGIRLVTVETASTRASSALVAFGGAARCTSVDLARELQMPEVIVPPFPGVTSAMGLLFVDPLDDFSWAYVRAAARSTSTTRALYARWQERVGEASSRQGVDRAEIAVERASTSATSGSSTR
jgi:N-methylhydantoinase A